MSYRSVLLLITVLAVPAQGVLAQGPAGARSVIADPDGLNKAVVDLATARRTCWERGEPRAADYVAEQDPAYGRTVMARYLMEETDNGWRWLPADLVTRTDVRATGSAEGYTDRVLEVDLADGHRGRARLRVDGPLSAGEVAFDWSVPPKRLCLADELDLDVHAEASGTPGSHGVFFILPLTREQMQVSGADVEACSPGQQTLVDPEIGLQDDDGRCVRPLTQLPVGDAWALWVSLPESFYVVYPYEPKHRKR